MLADSVVSATPSGRAPTQAAGASDDLNLPKPVLLLAPPVDEFLNEREGTTGYSILSPDGELLLGYAWLPPMQPATPEPEFMSLTEGGTTRHRKEIGKGAYVASVFVKLRFGNVSCDLIWNTKASG
jgi:hypothetical protein